jgi:hypothetical protein
MVNAGSGVALFALSYQVGEFVGVAAGFPDQRVHKDAAIQTYDIVAHLHRCLPPGSFDIVFQLDAEGPIVVAACQAAVDFAGLKDKTSSPAQAYDVVKFCNFSHNQIPQ